MKLVTREERTTAKEGLFFQRETEKGMKMLLKPTPNSKTFWGSSTKARGSQVLMKPTRQ